MSRRPPTPSRFGTERSSAGLAPSWRPERSRAPACPENWQSTSVMRQHKELSSVHRSPTPPQLLHSQSVTELN